MPNTRSKVIVPHNLRLPIANPPFLSKDAPHLGSQGRITQLPEPGMPGGSNTHTDTPQFHAIMKMPRLYSKEDVLIVERFSIELAAAVRGRIASVIIDRTPLLDHSPSHRTNQIPLVVFVDDLTMPMNAQDVRGYLHIVSRLVSAIKTKLHVSTVTLSEHWERFTLKEPRHLEIIRYGTSVYDKGFFDPLRYLVTKGRIRPSLESEGVYFTRAEATLKNASLHILHATLDLYWAGIDASHAALMKDNQLPVEPGNVSGALQGILVHKKLLEPEYPRIMAMLYELSRGILHKTITGVSGKDYDHYFAQTAKLVSRMHRMVG